MGISDRLLRFLLLYVFKDVVCYFRVKFDWHQRFRLISVLNIFHRDYPYCLGKSISFDQKKKLTVQYQMKITWSMCIFSDPISTIYFGIYPTLIQKSINCLLICGIVSVGTWKGTDNVLTVAVNLKREPRRAITTRANMLSAKFARIVFTETISEQGKKQTVRWSFPAIFW